MDTNTSSSCSPYEKSMQHIRTTHIAIVRRWCTRSNSIESFATHRVNPLRVRGADPPSPRASSPAPRLPHGHYHCSSFSSKPLHCSSSWRSCSPRWRCGFCPHAVRLGWQPADLRPRCARRSRTRCRGFCCTARSKHAHCGDEKKKKENFDLVSVQITVIVANLSLIHLRK